MGATALTWDVASLERTLRRSEPGWRVEAVPELDSTNTRLMEAARSGDTSPRVLVAECQTAGRGRLGRSWWSAPGDSLTWSIGLMLEPRSWSGLSLAVGLALAQALDEADRPPKVGIKWPNDLWLMGEDRKLAGILIETLPVRNEGHGEGARWTVIGMGINVRPAHAAAPQTGPDGAALFRTGYACTQEWWPQRDAPQVLHRVAEPVIEAVRTYAREGLLPLLPDYGLRDVLAGREVQAGEQRGIAMGPDDDGALRLRLATGGVTAVHSGEVSVRPC